MFIRHPMCPPPVEPSRRHEERRFLFHLGVICGFMAGIGCGLVIGSVMNRPARPRRELPPREERPERKKPTRHHGPKVVNIDW